jgi:predicted RNase H-like nuclease (RuvC/YqgF family)
MHLIVGIDPGKTSAIACLDLSGRLVYATHKTFAGVDWFVEEISRVGIPSVIACDREPGEMARKISAAFNVGIHSPQREGSVLAKREYAKRFNINNPHERDACYAAIKAYNRFANKLHQAEHIARGQRISSVDEIQAKVLERYSIEEAINNKTANRR